MIISSTHIILDTQETYLRPKPQEEGLHKEVTTKGLLVAIIVIIVRYLVTA